MTPEEFRELYVPTGERYRGICKQGDFKGKWRDNLTDAFREALAHQDENENHIIDVEHHVNYSRRDAT